MEDKGARLKFEVMAAIEMRHYESLVSYYQEKIKKPPLVQGIKESKIVRPETPPKTATLVRPLRSSWTRNEGHTNSIKRL